MPLDALGRTLSVGDAVCIESVDSCTRGLPAEDQVRLNLLVGQERRIVEFDGAGFIWLCFNEQEGTADFCLFPEEVALVPIGYRMENGRA